MQPTETWTRIPISRIEGLKDAVLGAGLEATQMSTGRLSGSLVYSESDGVICTSGLINGRVALFGPLSEHMVTLGVGLNLQPGARHWLSEVETGNVGVFHPGDDHDAIYFPGSMYAAITLTADKLEEEAARDDLILDRNLLGGTGIHPRNLDPKALSKLQRLFQRLHEGGTSSLCDAVGAQILSTLIDHLARPPHQRNAGRHPTQYGKIVERARAYIQENLCEPISVDELAAASYASRRTLFRAFEFILSEPPHLYVRRLRLHRIRHDLASEAERACTIALIANQWGISDIGRMSGWYRELFGERPSETVAGFRRLS